VHARVEGRFALHADGSVEAPRKRGVGSFLGETPHRDRQPAG